MEQSPKIRLGIHSAKRQQDEPIALCDVKIVLWGANENQGGEDGFDEVQLYAVHDTIEPVVNTRLSQLSETYNMDGG